MIRNIFGLDSTEKPSKQHLKTCNLPPQVLSLNYRRNIFTKLPPDVNVLIMATRLSEFSLIKRLLD
jgi:hypothetical protein